MSQVLQVFFYQVVKVRRPSSSQPSYFGSQYSDISKIFWIETLCSVLVHIPKAAA